MVKAVVLYGTPEDPDAFERYYAETHRALAKAIPGLERFEAAQGIATPDGGAVPYQRIAELTFEDMDALQAGLGSEQRQAGVTTSLTSPPAARRSSSPRSIDTFRRGMAEVGLTSEPSGAAAPAGSRSSREAAALPRLATRSERVSRVRRAANGM
jgi:uncharacterized protein (TIGR02118 family)